MAKPNYSFAKRQRELAKKAKKDEKLKIKRELKEAESGVDSSAEPGDEAPQAPQADS